MQINIPQVPRSSSRIDYQACPSNIAETASSDHSYTMATPSSVSSANQAYSHMQFPDPSEKRGAGRERDLFSPALRPPRGFGELATIYDQPRGVSAEDGVHSFIFAPPRTVRATTSNGIDKGKSDTYDFRFNDPLCHPVFKAYYNYEGRTFQQLTPLEKRVLEMAVHYPDIQTGIMRVRTLFIIPKVVDYVY